MHRSAPWVAVVIGWWGPVVAVQAARSERPTVPGRPVCVATIAIGFGGDRAAKLKLAREHLETAGQNGVDITGATIESVRRPRPQQVIATLDLDRTLVHHNFNEAKVNKLLSEQRGAVEVERLFAAEAWWLLRATKPGVSVRELCRRYQIETLREYRQRSREQINAARRQGGKIWT